jgi:hypothetical protein
VARFYKLATIALPIGDLPVSKSVASKDEAVVTYDRRREDRRQATEAQPPAGQTERRQKKNRRRQIDPTTCERDYSGEEIEFMQAMEAYKRRSGRMFPTCSEVLEVLRELGYVKLSDDQRTLVNG